MTKLRTEFTDRLFSMNYHITNKELEHKSRELLGANREFTTCNMMQNEITCSSRLMNRSDCMQCAPSHTKDKSLHDLTFTPTGARHFLNVVCPGGRGTL